MSEITNIIKHLSPHVEWTVIDEIGIISLNNPPQNYLEKPAIVQIDTLKNEIELSKVKGIIKVGKGRHFSAGANMKELKELASNSEVLKSEMMLGKEILNYIENLYIPVISVVKGACFGGGLEIALASHIIICAENALFAFPEVNYDIMPGLGGTVRLPRKIGVAKSLEIMLSGDIVDAQTAHTIKLADKVLPVNEVFEYSVNLMRKMTSDRSLKVINYIVKSLQNSRELTFQQAMHEETRMFSDLAVDEIFRNKNK